MPRSNAFRSALRARWSSSESVKVLLEHHLKPKPTAARARARAGTRRFCRPQAEADMAMNSDLQALRDYVTYDSGSLNKAETTVLLNVTHSNLKAMFMELRFDLHVRTASVALRKMRQASSCRFIRQSQTL